MRALATMFLTAALVAGTPALAAERSEPRLFALFQALCVNTSSEPVATRAAALRQGFEAGPPEEPEQGVPVSETFLKTIRGAEYRLSFSTSADEGGMGADDLPIPPSTRRSCWLSAGIQDKASLKAVFRWAQVAPQYQATLGEPVVKYVFRDAPSGRVIIPASEPGAENFALREGQVTSVFANTGAAYDTDRPHKETTLGIIVATPVAAP